MVFCHDKFAAGDTFYCCKVWADGSMKYWLWQKRQHSFQHVDPVNLSPQDVVGYVCHGFTDKRQRKERPGPGQTSQLFIFNAASLWMTFSMAVTVNQKFLPLTNRHVWWLQRHSSSVHAYYYWLRNSLLWYGYIMLMKEFRSVSAKAVVCHISA